MAKICILKYWWKSEHVACVQSTTLAWSERTYEFCPSTLVITDDSLYADKHQVINNQATLITPIGQHTSVLYVTD